MISMEVNKAFAESLEATEGGTPARLAPQGGPAMPGDAPLDRCLVSEQQCIRKPSKCTFVRPLPHLPTLLTPHRLHQP